MGLFSYHASFDYGLTIAFVGELFEPVVLIAWYEWCSSRFYFLSVECSHRTDTLCEFWVQPVWNPSWEIEIWSSSVSVFCTVSIEVGAVNLALVFSHFGIWLMLVENQKDLWVQLTMSFRGKIRIIDSCPTTASDCSGKEWSQVPSHVVLFGAHDWLSATSIKWGLMTSSDSHVWLFWISWKGPSW